jgi:hypothetical protein
VGGTSFEAEREFYSLNIPSPDGTQQQPGQHLCLAKLIWKLMFIQKRILHGRLSAQAFPAA